MPALKDEMVLNVDGILHVDPALGLRERAQRFVASRQWTTPSMFYGDQQEPDFSQDRPAWSMCFCLGLDHAMKTKADWFADVAALLEFVRTVAIDARCEFNVEFRLKSRLWYSESLTNIDDHPGAQIDLRSIRSMLELFIQQRSSWRVPDAVFRENWPRERRRGRARFIVTHGIFPWGMVAGLAFGAVAGHGVTGAMPPLRVVLWFIAGILLGGCVGFWRWNKSEQRYKVLTAQNAVGR